MPLTIPQQTIFDSDARFRVVSAGRRFGKSYLSVSELARVARYPNKRLFYVAPSYRMGKQIIWDFMKERFGKINWIAKANESDLTLTLVNNSRISVRSADNPDSMRGVSLDFAVLDECAYMDKIVWTEVLRPTLSDRQGGALFISTPRGFNWFYDLYEFARTNNNWASYSYTTSEGGNVSEEEIEAARADLDQRTFEQEYEAKFTNFAGLIYYNLGEHAIKGCDPIHESELLHVGCDFNTSPIVATIGTFRNNQLHIHDEIQIFQSNTYELVEEIRNRYPKNRIWVYPDASGNNAKTNSVKSDHNILREAGFTLKSGRSNPPVVDRIASVNKGFLSATGETTLTIDQKCKNLLRCLRSQLYKEGTRIPDKDSGFDHFPDALGYVTHGLMPIKRPPSERTGPEIYSHF
jgi:hypothetical protein